MIQIQCKETLYTYNLYHITKAFFPNAEIKQCVDAEQEPLVRIELNDGSCFLLDAKEFEENKKKEDAQEKKKIVTKMVYRFLSEKTGREMAWGMLTGVRPTKLAMHQMENGMNEAQAKAFLQEVYCVSEKKAGLAVDIACREKALLSKLDYLNGFSLYVGIPFCPSICSYCSFSSSPIDVWSPRMDDYLKALCIELHHIAKETEGKTLNTIYIGGGTPTTLTAKQLEKLLNVVDELFLNEERGAELLEYTVEAGRPDSITKEKLEVICSHPVTRISVNPQTMQQKTLDLVGRKHTVQAVKDIFHLARELGFDNINMDLIAGLPGENAEDMRDTLRQIEELSPDSLTVHSLAIKRAARMAQEQPVRDLHTEITEMVEDAAKTAEKLGLVPYYLYRQKNIAGNFENVGYAKADKAGIYNILIMEEKQTIYAAGAGATTKIVLPEKIKTENGKKTNLIRIENVKNIEEYIARIDEMIKRKSN